MKFVIPTRPPTDLLHRKFLSQPCNFRIYITFYVEFKNKCCNKITQRIHFRKYRKNFKPLPVRFEPRTSGMATTTPWKLNENERLKFLYF